jgi:F0F1-type ATP synthase delta subunit
MQNSILNILLPVTYTKISFLRRIRLIRQYLESVFFSANNQTLAEYLQEQHEDITDITTLSQLPKEFTNQFSKDTFYHLLQEASTEANNVPAVTMYTSFQPTEEYISGFCEWFRQHVQEHALIDQRIDAEVTGGCALVWKGFYKDFSMKFFMQQHKEQIHNIINDLLANVKPAVSTTLPTSNHVPNTNPPQPSSDLNHNIPSSSAIDTVQTASVASQQHLSHNHAGGPAA